MTIDFARYIEPRRWFRAKARGLKSASVRETFVLEVGGGSVSLHIVETRYADGGQDAYAVPIGYAVGEEASRLKSERPHLVVAETPEGIHFDALGHEPFLRALLDQFRGGGRSFESGTSRLVFRPLPAFEGAQPTSVEPRPVTTEQTNSSIVFGDGFILKILRQVDDGVSADLDMGEYLTREGYGNTPRAAGFIVIERAGAPEPATLGILHEFSPNEGDAWTYTLKALDASAAASDYAKDAALLGKRVGEMHAVLARGTAPSFAPEPLSADARRRLADGVRAHASKVSKWLPESALSKLEERLAAFVALPADPMATRVHGDLHLGQILVSPSAKDFVIIDFEGEPARPLADRKAKRSPMADVAGMLRSFDYAAASVLRSRDKLLARTFYESTARSFLAAYRSVVNASPVSPRDESTFRSVLDFYLLEKCLYEIDYEANNRPDWIGIPLDGLSDLLALPANASDLGDDS